MNEDIEFILDSTKEAMEKALIHLEKQFVNIRAGKATPAMLGSVTVEYSRRVTTGVTLEASFYHPDQMSKDTHFYSFDRDTRLHTAIKYSW